MIKPNLILLHGALGSENNFDSLKGILSNDFTVYTFSFRGHGKSVIEDQFSIKHFEEDLEEFYFKNKIEIAFLFGYSMGGYVALSFAFHHPEKVQKIFTYGTKFDWNPDFASKETAFLNPIKIEEKVPKFAESLRLQYDTNWTNVVEKTASMMIYLGNNPLLNKETLSAIKIPIRIGLGTKDHMVSYDESKMVSEFLPVSDLEKFEEWPHPIAFLNSQELAERIKKFFI